MIRKLAIALSLLGVCFAGFVQALGLGEATVKSALNQPLNAEIELVNTAGLSINEILPGLATREEFQKANVDRVYFLSDLRFEVKTNAQGKTIIVLTSKKPVREPFLNFLVELIWPSGRLLREYALLIDPPIFTETAPVKASAPSTSTSSSTGDVLRVPQATGVQKRSLFDSTNKIESGSYGPTTANDTLWDIAIKARPNRSVSPQQVMLAIQDLNPDAFMDGNINKMKAGQVLRLPTVDEIKERNQYQAIQIVIAQNEAHLGKRSPSVAQGSKVQSAPANKAMVPAAAGDELKLVVADDGKSGITDSANSGQSNQGGTDSNLAVTLEKLDKASIENKELTSRVGDLEEQLETLQRLLTLKNDQLAAFQSQMREAELAKLQNQAEQTVEETGASTLENISPEQVQTEAVAEPAVNEQAAGDTLAEGEGSQASDIEQTAPESVSAPVSPTADESEAAESTSVANEQKRQPASENIIEIIVNNPLYLSIALLGVLVLVFLLWLVSRHNAKKEQEFHSNNDVFNEDESTQYEVGSNYDEETEFDAYDEDDAEDSLESSDSDYGDELEDESQDVIAEANAYISYGRMDQAANILEKAISNDPVRTDYRLKLLSVYKDLGDRQAFERQFSELEAIQDTSALQKAARIREEMLDEELVALETKEANLSFDRDLEEQEFSKKNEEASLESEQEALENDLKAFDFDSVSLDETEDEIDLSSELDLDRLETDDLDTALVDAEENLELEDALDLDDEVAESDISEELADSVSSKSEAYDEDFDDSILDVDLEDLDLNAELEQESEIDLSEQAEDLSVSTPDADDLVVSDDILDEAIQELDTDSETNLDDDLGDADDFDFLSGTDEASTKLDLARAYIDMGDIDGAKDILQEVVKEGSEAQQEEAKELIASLN